MMSWLTMWSFSIATPWEVPGTTAIWQLGRVRRTAARCSSGMAPSSAASTRVGGNAGEVGDLQAGWLCPCAVQLVEDDRKVFGPIHRQRGVCLHDCGGIVAGVLSTVLPAALGRIVHSRRGHLPYAAAPVTEPDVKVLSPACTPAAFSSAAVTRPAAPGGEGPQPADVPRLSAGSPQEQSAGSPQEQDVQGSAVLLQISAPGWPASA